jgi:protein-tyrosine phosphatase
VKSQRHTPFSTVFNFRDLGGYPAADGRTIRWERIYRSDGLHRLTEADLDAFAAVGVRTVLDLRRPDELAADGRIVESLGLAYHNVNFHPAMWPEHDLGPDDMPRYLADRYAEMAAGGLNGSNAVGPALRLLVDADTAPIVFHCAAGKDRTGVLAALVLSLLGVDDDVIADDYALTAESERRYWQWRRSRSDAPPEDGHLPAWVQNPCPRDAMVYFLRELRDRHGTVEAYARRTGIGAADIETLRAHLLD